MEEQILIANQDGRLDVILSQQSGMTRSDAQCSIKSGLVSVNSKKVTKPGVSISADDHVKYKFPNKSSETIIPKRLDFEVLYEDSDTLVINKPRGIAVHGGSGIDNDEATIIDGVAWYFQKNGIPFSSEACLVHRLDKGTTGCLLIAKSKEAHEFYQQQFQERTIIKIYHAVITGKPSQAKATIDSPLERDKLDRTKYQVSGTASAREAQTSYEVLWTNEDMSLLSLQLHTGRTHQIRVHLHAINHPILGDSKYSSPKSRELTDLTNAPEFCLHAHSLTFVLKNDETQKVEASYDRKLQKLIDNLIIED